MTKLRVRFGIRLNIPIFKNAATFVAHLTQDQLAQAQDAVLVLNLVLPAVPLFIELAPN